MNKIINYFKNSKAEIAHVSWPTRRQAVAHTAIVVAAALTVAAYVAVLDYIFSGFVENFLI